MSGLDCLGADQLGFDYGALFKVAGGLVQGGVNIAEQQQAENKAAADSQGKLDAALKADMDASNAAAKADLSAQAKAKSAPADAAKAKQLAAAQDAAGVGLLPEAMQARGEAAEKMLGTMLKNAKASPKDPNAAALLKAWTATVQKIRTPVPQDGKKAEVEEGWLTRRVVGPVPGYAVLAGGLGLAGVLGLVVKKFL